MVGADEHCARIECHPVFQFYETRVNFKKDEKFKFSKTWNSQKLSFSGFSLLTDNLKNLIPTHCNDELLPEFLFWCCRKLYKQILTK